MSDSKLSHVALVHTEDRKSGVELSIRALGINPAKNKDVLIKPNFNTADLCPGSTHNDTLVALVEEVWKMGAKSVSLGERSYSENRPVMEEKGIIPLMEKLDVRIIDFDELDEKDWVKVDAENSHWQDGFRIARPILESECLGDYPVAEKFGGGGAHLPPWLQLHERAAFIASPAQINRRNECAL